MVGGEEVVVNLPVWLKPLEQITLREAQWLHAHRHLEWVHSLIATKNLLEKDKFDPAMRKKWNNMVQEWRLSRADSYWENKE
jgi:hypothetical protein